MEKMMKSLENRRARRRREKARYRAKHAEKLAEQKKRYRERNRDKIAEAKKQYKKQCRETHRENYRERKAECQKRYRDRHLERCREYARQYYYTHKEERSQYYKRYRKERKRKKEEATRPFMVEYQEKRDNTFGMTLQRQLDYFHSEKKRTEEKLKALGPQKMTIVLTDYLKSPPPPSMNQCTPIVAYLETFCQSLNEDEENVSLMDLLKGPTITNLDSGQMETMDQHVWDQDANQWRDHLIGDLEDPSCLENTVDVHDLLNDMTLGDWGHVMDDVLDQFDCDLLF